MTKYWLLGIVTVAIITFGGYVGSTVSEMHARVSVLENERINLWRKLDEMDSKLERIEKDIKDIERLQREQQFIK